MSENQVPTQPLDWNSEFLELLAQMDGWIAVGRKEGSPKWETEARYQTIIACGGYLGTRAKEMLNLRWDDVVQKGKLDLYQYKSGTKRKVFFNDKFCRIVDRNFEMIDPLNMKHLILHKKDNPMMPIKTGQFNQHFARILKRLDIEKEQPSSHTLRKTFAYHIYKDLYDETEKGLLVVSEMLDHKSIYTTRKYLGLSEALLKDVYRRL